MTVPCVSVHEVVKHYRLGTGLVQALQGISLEVADAEFVALCGASGSGKTTVLNLIGCLGQPTPGRSRWPVPQEPHRHEDRHD